MTAVIVQDHAGYRQRVRALQEAHPNVHPVTPWDKPHPHCMSIRPPEEWLPSDRSMPYGRRCWWKADAMGLAAVRQLGIHADYYWFVESDVVASQERWRALFADFEGDDSDLVAPSIRTKAQRPTSAHWRYAPGWAGHYILMACFRLSHAALRECLRCAPEMRDTFSEVTIPSVVHRAGLTLTPINLREQHCNTQTFAAHPHRVVVNPWLLNHPVKADTYGPLTTH